MRFGIAPPRSQPAKAKPPPALRPANPPTAQQNLDPTTKRSYKRSYTPMNFEWDNAKRLANPAKHGFDFTDTLQVFRDRHLIDEARHAATEHRLLAIGYINVVMVTAVFTLGDTRVRVISIRKARTNERRRLEALHS